MKYVNRILLFLLTGFLLSGTSCVFQELSDYCPEEIRVYFSYLDNEGNRHQRGINPSDVDRIHLYVYDSDGVLHTEYVDDNPALSPDYYITLTLYPGTYQLVAWGGDDQKDYTVLPESNSPGRTMVDEEIILLNRGLQQEVNRIQHHLFYAGPEKNATVREGNERFVLPVIQDTYTINLSIDCYDFPENELEVHIWDDNGSYDFNNSFLADSVHYTQPFVMNELNQYHSTIRVMRLAEYRSPRMVLYDVTRGKELLEVNLVELLVRMYDNGLLHDLDFDHLYEYDLPFTLCTGNNNGKIEVLVDMDAWHLVINGIILKPME